MTKLQKKQWAMLSRHKRVRPWDKVKREERWQSRARLRTMFRLKMSDETISKAFSISVQAVRFLRDMAC